MGILDSITGQKTTGQPSTGGGIQAAIVAAVMQLLANQQQSGGLAALVQRFAGAGLGNLVNSWIGTGQNQPATPQEIQQGMGPDLINKVAEKVGISPAEVSTHLSQVLPQVVDKLTPEGKVPPQDEVASKANDMLGGLGSLLKF